MKHISTDFFKYLKYYLGVPVLEWQEQFYEIAYLMEDGTVVSIEPSTLQAYSYEQVAQSYFSRWLKKARMKIALLSLARDKRLKHFRKRYGPHIKMEDLPQAHADEE